MKSNVQKHLKRVLLLSCLLLLAVAGCKEKPKFNRDRWYAGDGLDFPYRDEMVPDLLDSKMLIGLHYPRVVGLLHRPQGKTPTGIYYEVLVTFNKDMMHKKLLYLDLKDSVVTKAYLKDQSLKMIKQ